jgi:hypothetical protein
MILPFPHKMNRDMQMRKVPDSQPARDALILPAHFGPWLVKEKETFEHVTERRRKPQIYARNLHQKQGRERQKKRKVCMEQ